MKERGNTSFSNVANKTSTFKSILFGKNLVFEENKFLLNSKKYPIMLEKAGDIKNAKGWKNEIYYMY